LGVVPEHPFSHRIAGGRQTIYTAGLNWYVNRNVRSLLNYPHGDVAKQISPSARDACTPRLCCA
jgi:phosphate-selective porin